MATMRSFFKTAAVAAAISFGLAGAAAALSVDQANFDTMLGQKTAVVAEADSGNTLVLVTLNNLVTSESFSFDDIGAQFISATTFADQSAPSASLVNIFAGDPQGELVAGGSDGGVLVAPPGGPQTVEFQPLGSATTGAMDIAQVQTPSVDIVSGANVLFNALYLEVDIAFSDTLADGIVLTVIGETISAVAVDNLVIVQRVAAIPVPAAAPLLIAALGGLVLLRRRSAARAAA